MKKSTNQVLYVGLSFTSFLALLFAALRLEIGMFYWGSGFALGATLLNVLAFCVLKEDEAEAELNALGVHYIKGNRYRLIREEIQ